MQFGHIRGRRCDKCVTIFSMIRKLVLSLCLFTGVAHAHSHHKSHTLFLKPRVSNEITATSWLVADETGKVLRSNNIDEIRSIASISKLMTVMVVVDANQNLDERLGKYTRREHIQLALVRSDNKSAEILCENYPGGKEKCVYMMNFKAHQLHMEHTKFNEPTGLSVFNVSTANDLVNLVLEAETYPLIVEAGHTDTAKIRVNKKWFVFHNTNPLIGYKQNIIVSKTGYIRASGGCIVMMMDTEVGKRILVLLGSKNTHTRIPEAEIIMHRSLEE
jgi:serine-type D-Ala-D-Ala endopeptidase (penicillin-binding protein 7)